MVNTMPENTDECAQELANVLAHTEPNLTCTCLRCGHRWVADTVRMLVDAGMQVEAAQALEKAPPRRCAKCKSSYWDVSFIRKPNDHLGAAGNE